MMQLLVGSRAIAKRSRRLMSVCRIILHIKLSSNLLSTSRSCVHTYKPLRSCCSHVAQTQEHLHLLASLQGSGVQAHTAHAPMLFRQHLLQDASNSETENETEVDAPVAQHPHQAAAKAKMTGALNLGDTLPGAGHACHMPGVQLQRSSAMDMPTSPFSPPHRTASPLAASPLASIAHGLSQESAGSSAAPKAPGMQRQGPGLSPILRLAEPSLDAESDNGLSFPESPAELLMEPGVLESGVQVSREPAAKVDQHAAEMLPASLCLPPEKEADPWTSSPSGGPAASNSASDAKCAASQVQEPRVQVSGETAGNTDQHAAELSAASLSSPPGREASDATCAASQVKKPEVQVSGESAAKVPAASDPTRDSAGRVQDPLVTNPAELQDVRRCPARCPGAELQDVRRCPGRCRYERLHICPHKCDLCGHEEDVVDQVAAAEAPDLAEGTVQHAAAKPAGSSPTGMDSVKGVYPEDAVHDRNVQRAKIPNLLQKSRRAVKRLLKQVAQSKARKAKVKVKGKAQENTQSKTKGKAKGKACGKGKAKGKARGKGKAKAKARGKGKAKGKAEPNAKRKAGKAEPEAKGKAEPKAEPKAKGPTRAKRGTKNTFAGRAPPQNPDLLEIHNTIRIKFQELSPEQRQELAAATNFAADDAYWKLIHMIMGDRKKAFRRRAREGPGVGEGPGVQGPGVGSEGPGVEGPGVSGEGPGFGSEGPGVGESSGLSAWNGTAEALVEDCHAKLLFVWDKVKNNGFKAQISAAPSSAASSS